MENQNQKNTKYPLNLKIQKSTQDDKIYGITVLEKNNFVNLASQEIRKLKLIDENNLYNNFFNIIKEHNTNIENENSQFKKLFNLFGQDGYVYLKNEKENTALIAIDSDWKVIIETNQQNKKKILIEVFLVFTNMIDSFYKFLQKHKNLLKIDNQEQDLSTKEKACDALARKLDLNGKFLDDIIFEMNLKNCLDNCAIIINNTLYITEISFVKADTFEEIKF